MYWLSVAPRQADEIFGKTTPLDSWTKIQSVVKQAKEDSPRDAQPLEMSSSNYKP
jgi:hypothetical protein